MNFFQKKHKKHAPEHIEAQNKLPLQGKFFLTMAKVIADYNPNDVGVNNGNFFGMPFEVEDAQLVLVSAPWDVTSSYGGGSSSAPDAIIEASTQLDFYDPYARDQWCKGIATAEIDYDIQESSNALREDAEKIIEALENGDDIEENFMLRRRLDRVNAGSIELNGKVYDQTRKLLEQGKLVGLVGGDHSTPLGYIAALAERYESFGVLHIDAHCDLRKAYEGFKYSHASIMYNVLEEIPNVSRLVQVGVRDFCEDELAYAEASARVVQFSDVELAERQFGGENWTTLCDAIVEKLPERVYVSFDIDGLSPDNCPHTGTPVAGGLSFNQAMYLLRRVVDNGRRIIGFDLNEVVPAGENSIDASTGARVLFKLCGQTLRSNE